MSKNCPALQKSLAWCEGAPSHPGIRRRVFFCNKSLIVAWPTLRRDALGRPTSAVLQGNFELQADAYWQFLDINIDKSTVKSDPQGERPSQTQLNKGTFLHNGIGPEATAAAAWLNNSDNVYIYEDMLGRMRVLGNNKYATTSKVTQDQGQGTNPASTLIEVEVTDEVAAPFYNGTLETIDGEVSPETIAVDENDDTEPYVNTSRLEIAVGDHAYIDFGPKDGKWTFVSVLPNSVAVDANGKVSALNETRAPVDITCSHDGVTVAVVSVRSEIAAGDDNGEEPGVSPVDPENPSSNTMENVDLMMVRGVAREIDFGNLGNASIFIGQNTANVKQVTEGVENGSIVLKAKSAGEANVLALKENGDILKINITVIDFNNGENQDGSVIYMDPKDSYDMSAFNFVPSGGWLEPNVIGVAITYDNGKLSVMRLDDVNLPLTVQFINEDGINRFALNIQSAG